MLSKAVPNTISLCRAFSGLVVLISLIHLSISRSKSPELFPGYQNPRHLIAGRCREPNLAALTFDDFPGGKVDELLGLLAKWNATATFFINGPYDPSESVLQEQVLGPRVKKIHSAGHQIASHTYDHVSLQTRDAPAMLNDMTRLDRWLAELLGVTAPRFMRAPYGECDTKCARTLTLAGYKVIGWGFDTEDWRHATPQTVHRSIAKVHEYIGQLKARKDVDVMADIVLMHAFIDTTVTTVAPAVLEAFSREGYRFVSVAECLGYSQEMWYQ